MSSPNDVEILITFEELKRLEIYDISVCVDKQNALRICEESLAPPGEIFNLWIQKLFKAFELKKVYSKDWRRIIEYLANMLNEFLKDLDVSNDTTAQQLYRLWNDTKELLDWLTKNINSVDILILGLIITLALEVVIKTCKFANEMNVKPILNIQKLIVNLINKYMTKMPINDTHEFETFEKVISSLCDVGSLTPKGDIKISIETWRAVAKLSEKYNKCTHISVSEIEDEINKQTHWYEKAILGIFKELNELLQICNQSANTTNENFLQVCQFYLKLLGLFINSAGDKIKSFPAMQEFIEAYTLCHHKLAKNMMQSKVDLLINKGLFDIFVVIFKENSMKKFLLQHLINDVDNFESCDLVFDYLKIVVQNSKKKSDYIDICLLLEVYNKLFEGPLIFIDGDKYYKVLEYYVALLILDPSKELYKKLCEYILDSSWIRSYTSMEVLSLYYSFVFKKQTSGDSNILCLQFWFNIWNKLNRSTEEFKQQKNLVRILLKTIIDSIEDSKLLQFCNNKLENFEIILLQCGKHNDKLQQYFQTNLIKLLKKLQQRHINKLAYKELINMLEIGILRPEYVNNIIKVSLFESFIGLFCLPSSQFLKFHEFFNNCLRILSLLQDKQLNDKLLTNFTEYVQHCCNLQSPVLIEFLLTQRPQSNQLLQTLSTLDKVSNKIINLIDFSHLSADKNFIDLKIFRDLTKYNPQTNVNEISTEQISKRPRLDTENSLNIKDILIEMKLCSQKLMNINRSTYDSKDLESLNEIKSNIEKCLTN